MNSTVKQVLTVCNFVLLVVATIAEVVALMMKGGTSGAVLHVIELVTILFSFMYLVYGYKKNAAKFYKIYVILYAITILASGLLVAGSAPMPALAILMIIFGLLCVLGAATDLGVMMSLFYGYIILTLNIIGLVIAIAMNAELAARDVTARSAIVSQSAHAVMALALLIMIVAKYEDKATRHKDI